MSEYLSKKAVLEWLNVSIEGVPCKHVSISLLKEKVQSGAFDADESEGTWKATSEFAFRLNDQLEAENQRLRAALEKVLQHEAVDISFNGVRIRDIIQESLSTTEPTGAES